MIYAKSGMKGHNVMEWQKAISGNPDLKMNILPDGIFGSNTVKATIAVQKKIGAKADGIVGDGTKSLYEKKYPFRKLMFIGDKIPAKSPTVVKHYETKAKVESAKVIAESKAKAGTPDMSRVFPHSVPNPRPIPDVITKSKSSITPLAIAGAIGFAIFKFA